MSMKSEAVIQAFGGVRPMAQKLGATPSTVQHWKDSGAIPRWRWAQVREAARRHGVELPHDALRAAEEA